MDLPGQRITIAEDWLAERQLSAAGEHDFANYGSYIEALRRGEDVAIADVTTDPRTAAHADSFRALDIAALANLPLMERGHLKVIFCLHSSYPHAWSTAELTLARRVVERTEVQISRRAAEDELRALNATLEQQVAERTTERSRTWQYSPDLLSIIDMATGRFERVNPTWSETLGYMLDSLDGVEYIHRLHPDDIASSASAFEIVRTGQPVLNFENRYRHQDGSYRTLTWTAVPEGGKLYSRARDITEERERAAELTARTVERDRAWRLAQELLVVAAPDGTLEAINQRWTSLLGWTEEELIGTNFVDNTHPDDLKATLTVFAGILETPLTEAYSYRFRHKDGTYRWFGWTAAFEEGRVYASGRNLTLEREQAEALRQSQKMEAVGQLTGGLAHDFNNLLAVIIGSIESLQKRFEQGRFKDIERFITASQTAAKRATSLTHRLLAFSRRQTLDPQQTRAGDLIAGMIDMLRRTVGPEITIETAPVDDLWITLVDPNQLENALLNLCINARDAMPDGGRITIEAANKVLDSRSSRIRDMQPGEYVVISAIDTGTGMPPDVVARAFEPFYTTKPISYGTGLGLSMIYGFVRQSDGQVRIHSEIGQGTIISLYLPRSHGKTPRKWRLNRLRPATPRRGRRC